MHFTNATRHAKVPTKIVAFTLNSCQPVVRCGMHIFACRLRFEVSMVFNEITSTFYAHQNNVVAHRPGRELSGYIFSFTYVLNVHLVQVHGKLYARSQIIVF